VLVALFSVKETTSRHNYPSLFIIFKALLIIPCFGMKQFILFFMLFVSISAKAQEEGDTLYSRCPVSVTDTSGYNNYFTSHQNAIVKVEHINKNLVITIQQRDQFFTLFFRQKKLTERKYSIVQGADDKDELDAKYSFRSGGRASYINATSGTVDVTFNEDTNRWDLKINGLLKNLIERTIAVYKVKGEISIR
jgi:hypothetical protein